MTAPDADDGPADALVAEARGFVGADTGPALTGRDPVNRPMIHHWCDALDDENPGYLDPETAAETRHDGLIAPWAMLGSWTLDASGRGVEGPRTEVLRRLDRAGYAAVVATDYEQTYHRALRPGDRLSETLVVEDLSERKHTGLGPGYFVTVRHDYRDEDGELVGVARMRLLKFRPGSRDGGPRREVRRAVPPDADRDDRDGAPRSRRPRPPVNADTRTWWEGIAAGELRIQRCASCDALRHPPSPMCGACRSTDRETVVASGRGTVASWVVHHHPPLPGIEVPHTVLLVELEEGVRVAAELTGAGPDAIAVGTPVELTFLELDEDLTVPAFRPTEAVT